MRSTPKKLILIIAMAFVLLGTAVGTTLAYIFDRTPSVENSFEPVYVSCAIEERFDGVTKSEVKVRNTGDINVFIRATFVAMWVADDGKVLSVAPVEGVDYAIQLGSSKWQKGSDGFYYYTSQVAPTSATEMLIDTISVTGDAPKGYKLAVHVAATAIQAEPAGVIAETWGATVQTNGTIIAP